MRRRLRSHLVAILVTLLIVIGLPRLPAIFGLGLPSWFSLFWLLLAVLVLLAHLQRAQLLGRRYRTASKQKHKQRRRSET